MSKFIEHLEASLMGHRRVVPEALRFFDIGKEVCPADMFCQTEDRYRYHVHFEMQVYCKPEHEQHHTKNVVREMKEVIYGELRSRLLALERAVYDRSEEDCGSIIRDIMREVFE